MRLPQSPRREPVAEVVLLDKARFPRDKFCGDGLTTGALRLLEGLGLQPDKVPSWTTASDVMVSSPSGRTARFPLPRGNGVFAAVARRVDLDAALLQVVRDEGVRVLDGHRVTAVQQRPDRVVVQADDVDEIHARYLVAADGMWSSVRKLLRLDPPATADPADPAGKQPSTYLGEWHAFRQYFTDVGPAARDLWVWFEPDILPGYAWSFPLPDGAGQRRLRDPARRQAVHAGHEAGVARAAAAGPQSPRCSGPTPEAESPHRAWPIPARIDDVPLCRAGRCSSATPPPPRDPMTGEGIGQALLTGIAAAEAIEHGGPPATQTFGRRTRRRSGASWSPTIACPCCSSAPSVIAGAHGRGVAIAGATPWTRRNFARWLFEDEPRAIAVTPGRWHRHFLSRPGAYRERHPVL